MNEKVIKTIELIQNSKDILIEGHFDCDGFFSEICAVDLVRITKNKGPNIKVSAVNNERYKKEEGDGLWLISPTRYTTGYGLSLEKYLANKDFYNSFDLYIAVDQGIANPLEVYRQMKEAGVKILVIDHHHKVKNQKEEDFFKYVDLLIWKEGICATNLTTILASHVNKHLGYSYDLSNNRMLAGIATIADVMDVNESLNRKMINYALKHINEGKSEVVSAILNGDNGTLKWSNSEMAFLDSLLALNSVEILTPKERKNIYDVLKNNSVNLLEKPKQILSLMSLKNNNGLTKKTLLQMLIKNHFYSPFYYSNKEDKDIFKKKEKTSFNQTIELKTKELMEETNPIKRIILEQDLRNLELIKESKEKVFTVEEVKLKNENWFKINERKDMFFKSPLFSKTKVNLTLDNLGFVLSPVINACGRLEFDPYAVISSFSKTINFTNASNDVKVNEMLKTNERRKEVTKLVNTLVEDHLPQLLLNKELDDNDPKKMKGIFLDLNEIPQLKAEFNEKNYLTKWLTGIVGLVAANLVSKYGLTFSYVAWNGHGSGRCADKNDVFKTLEFNEDFKGGGHSQAFGAVYNVNKYKELKTYYENKWNNMEVEKVENLSKIDSLNDLALAIQSGLERNQKWNSSTFESIDVVKYYEFDFETLKKQDGKRIIFYAEKAQEPLKRDIFLIFENPLTKEINRVCITYWLNANQVKFNTEISDFWNIDKTKLPYKDEFLKGKENVIHYYKFSN